MTIYRSFPLHLLVFGIVATFAPAQAISNPQKYTTSFDVVSVRPSESPSAHFSIRPQPDDFSVSNSSLNFLIQYAYDVQEYQILDGEHWTKEEKFDVRGKTDDAGTVKYPSRNAGDKVLQARIRAALADRFKLNVTESTALLPVLILQKGPGNPHLNPPKAEGNFTMGWGLLTCNNTTMSEFAELLSAQLRRPVIDRTNLTGSYSFEVKWNPDETAASSTLPTIESAVREELGLRLSSSKSTLRVLHIVSAQRPTPN